MPICLFYIMYINTESGLPQGIVLIFFPPQNPTNRILKQHKYFLGGHHAADLLNTELFSQEKKNVRKGSYSHPLKLTAIFLGNSKRKIIISYSSLLHSSCKYPVNVRDITQHPNSV